MAFKELGMYGELNQPDIPQYRAAISTNHHQNN